jgi:DNA helicase II / ATP-dependent DNA helicase PcrA
MDSFLEEKEKLRSTTTQMDKVLDIEKNNLKTLPSKYGYDPRLLQSLMGMSHRKITNLEKGLLKPYFARIDFTEKLGSKEKIYIGKTGSLDSNDKIMITDWRAPISTIYYDCNLGNISYIAPQGKIEGELSLKRQIVIENRELLEVYDVDSVSDDELLKPFLGASADNRLKNIVASIQSEQNDIIRQDINKNLIIEGVAGSGKTTVALHKIAYLVYNYNDTIKPDQFMVIGPNKFFINYISTVLPDLDVSNVVQLTYEELCKEYINEKINILDPTEKLIMYINKEDIPYNLKIKNSFMYKEAIDKFILDFEKVIIPNNDFIINDIVIISRKEILDIYNSYLGIDNIKDRIDMVINVLIKRFKSDEILSKKIKEKNIDNDIKWGIIKLQKNGFSKELKQYFKLVNIKILELYKMFVNNVESYIKVEDNLKFETIKNINNRNLDFEDIPALMYLKILLNGIGDYKNYRHVVIDESQDFGSFNFFVLKTLMKKSTFSIFGDITQGIYEYRSIDNFEEVKTNVFENNVEIKKLKKSYRTSIEIMIEANKISKHLNLNIANPVIRHSEDVKYSKVEKNNEIDYIFNQINESMNKGYKSIAVICKTVKETKEIYNKLKEKINNIEIVLEDNEKYNGGICIITSYLAKGLEFDSVIIHNADEFNYNSDNKLDMKLLYVAMTRALHNLEILYNTNLVNVLK